MSFKKQESERYAADMPACLCLSIWLKVWTSALDLKFRMLFFFFFFWTRAKADS